MRKITHQQGQCVGWGVTTALTGSTDEWAHLERGALVSHCTMNAWPCVDANQLHAPEIAFWECSM